MLIFNKILKTQCNLYDYLYKNYLLINKKIDIFSLRPSECTPLFNAIYQLRRSGAALHSHSI
jgi:ribulose-5-phosphate 4-epimerase/fuculose-1-phosphate aldolase